MMRAARRRQISIPVLLSTLMLSLSCFSEREPLPTGVDAFDCSIPAAAQIGNTAFVPIRGYEFLVDTLRVRAGTTVFWLNCEQPPPDPHTVTSDGGLFSSPFFGPGESYARRFDTPGRYPYHCTPHPSMRAVVIVE